MRHVCLNCPTRWSLITRLRLKSPPAGRYVHVLHAALAEPCVLGHGANLLDVPLDICGNALAVSTHTTRKIDTMVVVADGADAVCDVLTLLSYALVCTAGHFAHLLGLLQAHGLLWGAAQTAFFGLVTSAVQTRLDLTKLPPGFGGRFFCGPLCGRHRCGNGLAAFMLHMEHVRRVVRLQRVFPIGQ